VAQEAFTPRWASPPGRTIRLVLDARGLSVAEFAAAAEMSPRAAESLLAGDTPITMGLARRLESAVGGSVAFWLQRDGQYRDSLALVAADHWADAFPTADLASLGWIDRPRTWTARIETMLGFFDVPDTAAWQRAYGAMLAGAQFRVSQSAPVEPMAVAAWLRRAEVEATAIEVATWSAADFRRALDEVRPLTRERDPAVFVPALRERCAASGVAVVVVRAPRGCPVSGAARFVDAGRPQIVLSGRYLSDDHLWFTFYHEAAHLLLDGPGPVFVDALDDGEAGPKEVGEAAADAMAGELLLPGPVRERLAAGRIGARDLVGAARVAGVSPGIVVGQLQHAGLLGYRTRFNGLKRRFAWRGASLGRA
jgi:HTH-type transcriptional regulator / antitoxin HigA